EQPGSDNRSKDAIAETTGNVNEVAELPGPSGLTTNVTQVLEYAAQGDNLKKEEMSDEWN
ncbi:unnamed protein product, partial [Allacma fusca]